MRIWIMLLGLLLAGCGETCGGACSVDNDCADDLICAGGKCAPPACESCTGSCNFINHRRDNVSERCEFSHCGP